MKYYVNIEETVNGIFEVEANSEKEAFDIAKQKYFDCEFVNEPGELVEKRIAVRNKWQSFNNWEVF